MSKYQLLPPLTDDEYEALKANIAARGVLQPVVVDEAGAILDGHHRAQACDELGIEYPRLVLEGLTELEKIEQALMLNLGRRHLTQEQRRALVRQLHDADHSVRWIAKATGISKSTVHRYVGVPDGTGEAMTAAEADEITEEIRNGLAHLLVELDALSEERRACVVDGLVGDCFLEMPPGEPRDWFVGWLLDLVSVSA
jgi:ParB-like chromosome segregation protein Spo0J